MNQYSDFNTSFDDGGLPLNTPVRIISKSLPVNRAARLRLSWFTLGVVFSLFISSLFNQFASVAPQQIMADAKNKTAPKQETYKGSEIAATAPTSAPEESPEPAKAVVTNVSSPPKQVLEPPKKAAKQYPVKLTLVMEKGDTLSTLLEQLGVSKDETNTIIASIRKHYNLRKLAVGQNIKLHLDVHPTNSELATVKSLSIPLSKVSSLKVAQINGDKFTVKKQQAKIERNPTYASGEITSSLYETAAKQGIPASIIARVINAYSYDVDFQREIRSGDKINLLYEKLETEDGQAAGSGNILYAKLRTGNRTHTIYRFTDRHGDADFYNKRGESVRKGLLRTPVNGARITSRFGMRRHPILGYSKMHRGVDFGAPRGTPVYAAGDGIVSYAGRKGGYGNYLRIRHNGTYSTAYAHLHRFASGIRRGQKVKQGRIIAYVGTTGRSTGPHLHYEVLRNGRQVNPSGVKFKAGNILAGAELKRFKKHVTQVDSTIAKMAKKQETEVALLEKDKKKSEN